MPSSIADPHASLVQCMLEGDAGALRALYDRTSARVYAVVLRIAGDRVSADDALEDTYVQAWRRASSFDPARGSVLAWLLAIARTRAIDLRRASGGREAREREAEISEIETLPGEQAGPFEEMQRSERAWLVRSALNNLPEPQARAIRAAFFEGLSHVEVARELGEPLGTVKTRIRSGLSGLRSALESLRRETA